jgi:hypothetical protein
MPRRSGARGMLRDERIEMRHFVIDPHPDPSNSGNVNVAVAIGRNAVGLIVLGDDSSVRAQRSAPVGKNFATYASHGQPAVPPVT